ncbi:hypothetical protein RHMOL_Rhmol10G0286000 [Rhododendron molle]|uniref:Uncharacterized protein n=1 Tax=Rhododendron molle TaxID=49168 RepID=A0ACC0M779_RHOML|nr:hypothetical protein RHMOL_Rhmol10G0286000 [Rhododendron molle]
MTRMLLFCLLNWLPARDEEPEAVDKNPGESVSEFPENLGDNLYFAGVSGIWLARGVRVWEIYMAKEDSRDGAEAS